LRALLLADFDKYVDYFPDTAEILSCIERKQVLLNRDATGIKGYILFRLLGKVCNFNYLRNLSRSPLDCLFLLQNFFAVLSERGIKKVFGWVNVKNTGVLELHKRFGLERDGLLSHFYLKRHKASQS
jgi:hypothetical protein